MGPHARRKGVRGMMGRVVLSIHHVSSAARRRVGGGVMAAQVPNAERNRRGVMELNVLEAQLARRANMEGNIGNGRGVRIGADQGDEDGGGSTIECKKTL